MPNGRALYDSIRDCLDCSRLHTRSALYDGIIYIYTYIYIYIILYTTEEERLRSGRHNQQSGRSWKIQGREKMAQLGTSVCQLFITWCERHTTILCGTR